MYRSLNFGTIDSVTLGSWAMDTPSLGSGSIGSSAMDSGALDSGATDSGTVDSDGIDSCTGDSSSGLAAIGLSGGIERRERESLSLSNKRTMNITISGVIRVYSDGQGKIKKSVKHASVSTNHAHERACHTSGEGSIIISHYLLLLL